MGLDVPLGAHPKVDRVCGKVFFHGYSLLSSKAFLRTRRLGADGKVSPSLSPPARAHLRLLAEDEWEGEWERMRGRQRQRERERERERERRGRGRELN